MQIKCLQTLRAIFERSSKSVSVPYIHALAPRVVELFGQHAAQIAVDNISKNKHDGIMEALAVLETLIEIVEQNKSKCRYTVQQFDHIACVTLQL